MIRRSVAFVALLSMFLVPLPKARAQETADSAPPLLLARASGPILWYIDDPEMRQRMENDLELLRLWNEAAAAKRKRKALSLALFTPGAILIGVGFVAGVFQNAIGLYDAQTGDYIMVGSFGIGVALVTPGIYFAMTRSDAEKAYEKYMKATYGITPILQLNPRRREVLAGMRMPF
jgi:hypothetical protein